MRNLHKNLNELIETLSNGNIFITKTFAGQLIQWGQFPSRFKIENFIKMLQSTFKMNFIEEIDFVIGKIRKCFENSFDSEFQEIPSFLQSSISFPINLIIDKDLNMIPFESLQIFSKFTCKRVPILLESSSSYSEIYKKVFYIINPSGDLHQTQKRFEGLFKDQHNWEGIIGRKPTCDEFFNGICGRFDLFIYFGHSSGENYAPLKELKTKMALKGGGETSSALLIGCSSGRIKSNGIFPAESSIFYYLENKR